MSLGILTCSAEGAPPEATTLWIMLQKILPYYNIHFIFTNSCFKETINYCRSHKIPCFIGNPKYKQNGYKFIESMDCDVIVSLHYHYVIQNNIISHPKQITVNFHPSLLPKYGGVAPLNRALMNGENCVGITCHKIDKGIDTGPIIKQVCIPIDENITTGDLRKKMYSTQYIQFVNEVLGIIETGSYQLVQQDVCKATYFSKITEHEMIVNWNWQMLSIKNLVRALSYPFWGAFTLFRKNKIIIDEVVPSKKDWPHLTQNGTILQVHPELIVKCANGALCLTRIRYETVICFKTGAILGQ